jgi:hypothetical protein
MKGRAAIKERQKGLFIRPASFALDGFSARNLLGPEGINPCDTPLSRLPNV